MASKVDRGLLQFHKPEWWRFYRYGDDEDGEPLFSFYMNLTDNTGVCLYDRNGGHGKFHWTAHDPDEYEGVALTDGLEDVVADAIGNGRGVAREDVLALPDHKEYFFRVLHGILEQKGRLPDELLRFIEHCVEHEVRMAPDTGGQ